MGGAPDFCRASFLRLNVIDSFTNSGLQNAPMPKRKIRRPLLKDTPGVCESGRVW
jgi:hypothetical protein